MRLTFHRAVFWAHLIAGLAAGLVILSLAVTGLLIAFEVQITEWANRDLRVVPAAENAAHLDVETLLARIQESKPGFRPTGITWKGDPAAPVTLTVGREGIFFANPYTGGFLGEGNRSWHDFFHAATEWHRFLTGTGLSRDAGKAITGAGCLIFGLLLVSGLYLWWPRQWRWPNVRAVTVFNRRLKGRARDWNWHNVIGFWSAFPMLLIVLTGLIMSYGWANHLLFTLAGSEPPPARERPAGGPGGTKGGKEGGDRPNSPPPQLGGLVPLLEQARMRHPGWQTLSLRMPAKPGDPFPVMIDLGGRGEVHRRTMLSLDTAQNKVSTSPDDFSRQNPGRQWRMIARFLHTGELFGLLGQTVAALCALSAILLVWTGFALAWRRFFRH
ncbi:MAG: PepSY domain-containing protein [Prosthecobacter sp.]|jgi:uncharacterized iron-regulated membrane protein|uniref:PepSY-associated TM helix domain-containing protein n=1 Tax=Prosthecobacter sp. TaxID=1965333 RepID=UPI001A083D56|nr:PepSY-associated TM helix domain-containing protein [Prosthecobacter sp.]MBE2284413.1 PepSY domain-containing protein [Prosthecobacter sp.]